jgi:AmmeMemoRadiSam system protein B/AmmeMemoRadiSam system protein A
MMKGRKKKGKGRERVNINVILVAGIAVVAVVVFYSLYQKTGGDSRSLLPEAPSTASGRPVTVRKPAVAGAFYPANAGQLSGIIDDYLRTAESSDIYGVRGLVSPHAGYIYSGPVAAYGFKLLQDRRYETVIVMGPSHYHGFEGASIPDVTHYETPLGRVELSPRIHDMYKEDLFVFEPRAHEREHSVEVQIPFLQTVLPKFKLIPVVVGDVDPRELAVTLLKYVDDDTLVVASTDLSHYHPYDKAVELDDVCIKAIPSLDFKSMLYCQACGRIPVTALMYIAQERGWSGRLLDYRNSGDTAGDRSRGVVGYASIAFYDGLVEEEQEYLLELARNTLLSYYAGGLKPSVDEGRLTEGLREQRACFVTLRKDGDLRGCIGHLSARVPLYECVIENALNAALHDSRFAPVQSEELRDLSIEVSVLTEPRLLPHDSPEDLLDKLVPGTDGVVIKYGWRESTYLPVVWDMIPDKKDFLGNLCLKAGSPADCWRSEGAWVYTYQAQEFGE